MKNILATQQSTQIEENMSNLTSASNEASVSSSNRNDNGGMFLPQYNFQAPLNQSQPQPQPVKKKRNQPGHPDPDSEVIALSPRTLLATNRFVCEICNKGFQRDQNLQLHRRGHNLPWKLKQRSNKDIIRKKVYVCPETSCVHHDPSRALGDLTGIKKHFCRKHGEKKWKCEKCSKKYAVQSDWKAHSKTCGTREYRCDCGTLFSRRDSFITHRAFCDALAEENARSITNIHHPQNNFQQIQSEFNSINNPNHDHQIPIKKEQQSFMMSLRPSDHHHHIPPWLSATSFPPPTILGSTPGGGPPTPPFDLAPTPTSMSSSSPSIFQDFHQNQDFLQQPHQNPKNPNTHLGTTTPPPLLPPYHPPPPPHISATALLQKAAQMGSKSSPPSPPCVFNRPHNHHQPGHVSAGFGLNLSSRDGFITGLASYGNKAADTTVTVTGGGGGTHLHHQHNNNNSHSPPPNNPNHTSVFHDMIMNHPGTFEDMTFGGILSHASIKKDYQDQESLDFHAALDQFSRRNHHDGNINDGMTRDFLGLRALSQSDILSIAGLSNCMESSDTNAYNNEH